MTSNRAFAALIAMMVLLFPVSLWLIAAAPYESTMGLVQKIFYFHVPSWMAMAVGVLACGVGSAFVLFQPSASADQVAVAGAEVAVLFGACGLVTGPLWARKAWGIWWTWDAKLTTAFLLELTFVAYVMVRRFGGLGSSKLAAAVGLFGLAVAPFVWQATSLWRTMHPLNTVVPTLVPGMRGAFWTSGLTFVVLATAMLLARMRLEQHRYAVDELFLELQDD